MQEKGFFRGIEQIRARADELRRQVETDPAQLAEMLPVTLADLQNTLEELTVAQEELRQQNEELVAAQAATAAALGSYQDLFEFAPDSYLVTDAKGSIVETNQVAARLLGASRELLLGKPLVLYVAVEQRDDYHARIARITPGQSVAWTAKLRARDGRLFPAAITLTATQEEPEGPVSLRWMLRDMTEHERMEDELIRARNIESIGALAGGIAHDFNNYLTVILGDIGLAKRRVDSDSPAQESLEQAEQATLMARGLSQQLLAFSRGGAPVTKVTSLKELVPAVAGFAVRGANVTLDLSVAEDLWPAMIDEAQIGQVLTNLIQNATEAMPEGGVVEVRARNAQVGQGHPAFAATTGDCVEISVTDHGRGIPADVQHRVFEPYFSTKEEGSGLGLATAYSIVHRHHGSIAFQTKTSVGTTFTLYLPAQPAAMVRAETRALEPAADSADRGKVLVVDDEPMIRVIVTAILADMGYRTGYAREGAEAVELYRQATEAGEPYDAVIMDLVMPGGMGGVEAAQKLLEVDPRARVVVSSGYSSDPIMANYREHGFCGVVPKPYTLEGLAETLREVMCTDPR